MSINLIVRPILHKGKDSGKKAEFLSTLKYQDRTPGIFKAEMQGTRTIALMSKCYCAKDAKSQSKFSYKNISKKQNPMSWERYLEALNRSIDLLTNTGFQIHHHRIVTYTQDKLDLSTYYNKCIVAPNGIQTEPQM